MRFSDPPDRSKYETALRSINTNLERRVNFATDSQLSLYIRIYNDKSSSTSFRFSATTMKRDPVAGKKSVLYILLIVIPVGIVIVPFIIIAAIGFSVLKRMKNESDDPNAESPRVSYNNFVQPPTDASSMASEITVVSEYAHSEANSIDRMDSKSTISVQSKTALVDPPAPQRSQTLRNLKEKFFGSRRNMYHGSSRVISVKQKEDNSGA